MAFKMNGWSPFTQIKGKKVTDTKKDVESPRWIGISKERRAEIEEREYDKKLSKKGRSHAAGVHHPSTGVRKDLPSVDAPPDVVKKKDSIPRLQMKKKVTKGLKKKPKLTMTKKVTKGLKKKIYPKPIGRKV